MAICIKGLLKLKGYRNIPLNYGEAFELGCLAIAACRDGADPLQRVQSITALSVFHNQETYAHPDAAEQVAGVCAAVFAEDIGRSKAGFIRPNVPYVMDNCGMGGDLLVTANVSTLAGLIAAAAGINVCKHGSPANADNGRHGSSDFIYLLGIEPRMSKDEVELLLPQHHFAYTEALDTRFKLIHQQTHTHAGLPHMNDIIGPITNPVDPQLLTRRVIGVNHLLHPRVIARAYQILNDKGVTNMQELIAVRGLLRTGSDEGVDELSVCSAGSEVAGLRAGEFFEEVWVPTDFGLEALAVEQLSPPSGVSKGQFSLGILHGDVKSPVIDMVLANAALLFMLAYGFDKRTAYEAARDAFESGETVRLVDRLQNTA